MTAAFYSAIASTWLMASKLAHGNCSPIFTKEYASAERIVDSLRPDKPGQMRVYAYDGSEYSAGESLWMKGQLRSVLHAGVRGDDASAASTLHSVTDLLNSQHRAP
jgi:hypothetical protein